MNLIDFALYLSYGLIIIAILGSVILPLINSLGDPMSLLKTGAGVIAILAVFFISYALASNEVSPMYANFGVDASLSKWIGGAIITMFVLIIIAIGSIIFTEISKLFK